MGAFGKDLYRTLHDTHVTPEDGNTAIMKGFPSPLALSPEGRGGRGVPSAQIYIEPIFWRKR